MENLGNKNKAILKNFGIQYNADGTFQHLEKGGKKTGVYTNTSENRKLGRVGQKYKKKKGKAEASIKQHDKMAAQAEKVNSQIDSFIDLHFDDMKFKEGRKEDLKEKLFDALVDDYGPELEGISSQDVVETFDAGWDSSEFIEMDDEGEPIYISDEMPTIKTWSGADLLWSGTTGGENYTNNDLVEESLGGLWTWENVDEDYFDEDLGEDITDDLKDTIDIYTSDLKMGFESLKDIKDVDWASRPNAFEESSDIWNSLSAGSIDDVEMIYNETLNWIKAQGGSNLPK